MCLLIAKNLDISIIINNDEIILGKHSASCGMRNSEHRVDRMFVGQHRMWFEAEERVRGDTTRFAVFGLFTWQQATERRVGETAGTRRRPLLHALELHAHGHECALAHTLFRLSMQTSRSLARLSLPQRQAFLRRPNHARLLAQFSPRRHSQLHDRKSIQGKTAFFFFCFYFFFFILDLHFVYSINLSNLIRDRDDLTLDNWDI